VKKLIRQRLPHIAWLGLIVMAVAVSESRANSLTTGLPAAVIQGGMLEQIAAEKNLLNQLNQSQADFARTLQASKVEVDYRVDVDTMNQLGNNDCAGSQVGAVMGKSPPKIPSSDIPVVMGGRASGGGSRVGGRSEQNKARASQVDKGNVPDAVALFSPDPSEDILKATITTLIAPNLPADLPDSLKKTPAGISSLADRQRLTAALSLSTESIQRIARNHRKAPDMTQPEVDALLSMVFAGPIPAPASPQQVMDALVMAVYANPRWMQWLDTAETSGVRRAQSMLSVISAKQDSYNDELMNYLVSIKAARLALASEKIHKNTRNNAAQQAAR